MSLYWKSKFDAVVKEILANVLFNDDITYRLCDVCYCSKARMLKEIEGRYEIDHICLDCYQEDHNVQGCYYNHIFGRA